NDDLYVGGKRYLVRVTDSFEFGQQSRYGFGEMVLATAGLTFAESIGATHDIAENGLVHSQELGSYAMGLVDDDDSQKYAHREKEFASYNAGNVDVHPFEQYIRIEIENAVEDYSLRNITTGDEFKYTGNNKGKLVIDGANITIKGLQS